jgi:hypothetical protein
MTVFRGFAILIGSTFAGFIVGLVGGFIMGHLTPTYFITIWRAENKPWFNPVEMAVAMGTTQGAIVGFIAGAIVVLAVAWYNSRREALDVSLGPVE